MERLWVLSFLVFVWACGAERADFGPNASGGKNSTGGAAKGGGTAKGGSVGSGGSSGGASGGNAALAPAVEILRPAAVSDPNADDVLVVDSVGAGSVDVVCKVSPSTAKGSSAVDPSSIKIALLDGAGALIKEVAGASTGRANEYIANFVLTSVSTGVVSFRCTVSDTSSPRHTGAAKISTFLDHGPTITVKSPEAGSAYARQSGVHFEFTVEPTPLSDDDLGADVVDVGLRVNGVAIDDLQADPEHTNVYSADVDFSDPALFPPTLTGTVSIAIEATNSRTPLSATQTEAYTILLDGSSPVVTIKSPPANSIIGGQVQLAFTVDDGEQGAGVDLGKLIVSLGTTEYVYDPRDPAWTATKGAYTFAFDSTKFEGSVSQVTALVRAWDLAGNGPASAQMFLYLDNAAPFVSLTPFQIRAITHSSDGKQRYCSTVFNPLGESMADGAVGNRFMLFRAFAWDNTNGVESQNNIYYSGVDRAHVKLYLQPDSSQPLIVDGDGDGVCDSVAADVKLMPSLDLMPIPSQGTPDNNPPDFTSPPNATAGGATCTAQVNNPQRLCGGHASDLAYVIRQNYGSQRNQSSNDAAIYAGSVGAMTSVNCTGDQWDVASVTKDRVGKDGWLCLTAEALDTAGNVGIAAPLRVCLDDETVAGVPPCANSSVKPPTCTDGCTPPRKGFFGDDAQGKPIPFTIEYP